MIRVLRGRCRLGTGLLDLLTSLMHLLAGGRIVVLSVVRRSVGAQEPGGGRLTEVLRCFLEGPVEAQDSALVDASDS